MSTPLIFLTVGTSKYPFDRLLSAIANDPLYHSDSYEWVIQSGRSEVSLMPKCGEVHDMLTHSEIEEFTKKSSFVISHAGIGSIYLMLKYEKLGLFVPRVKEFGEHTDDHQLQLAREIKNDRITVCLPTEEFPSLDSLGIGDEKSKAISNKLVNYDLANIIKQELEY